jgi:hypothetical protein
MEKKKLRTGDLVVVDMSNPAWKHLSEKGDDHPLRLQGVVTKVNEKTCVIKFNGWTAYLKESDVVRVS